MPLENPITLEDIEKLEEVLDEDVDHNKPHRKIREGETFWSVANGGFDIIDKSGTKDLMFDKE